MMLFKRFSLLSLLIIIFCSFFNLFPVLAASKQPMKPIILDAYSNAEEQGIRIQISGLIKDNLEVLVYIDGKYKGLANISKKNKQINPFRFSVLLDEVKKSYNISVISKNTITSVLSPPAHATDRRVSQQPKTKPSVFKGGSSEKNKMAPSQNKDSQVTKNYQNKKTAPRPPAPTLVGPNMDDIIGTPKPLILGLTPSKTRVHIYIDGKHNGKTPLLHDPSGTANFAYRPFLNLKPGRHEAYAIAENFEGEKGPISKKIFFVVEEEMVSPTISTKNKLKFTKAKGLNLVGWAKNNSLVKIFVDHFLQAKFKVKNHPSQTANFSYNSDKILSRGKHLVYATAVDERGKESPWSNIIYFTIYDPKIATSASEQANNPPKTSASGTVMKVEKDPQNPSSSTNGKLIKTKEVGTAKGISEENDKKTEVSKSPQNKKLNITIFVLFILAISVWMFLVNKELSKENKKQEKNKQ